MAFFIKIPDYLGCNLAYFTKWGGYNPGLLELYNNGLLGLYNTRDFKIRFCDMTVFCGKIFIEKNFDKLYKVTFFIFDEMTAIPPGK